MIALTALNPFERFDDGRPRVPDDLIERMKLVTTEEAGVCCAGTATTGSSKAAGWKRILARLWSGAQ